MLREREFVKNFAEHFCDIVMPIGLCSLSPNPIGITIYLVILRQQRQLSIG